MNMQSATEKPCYSVLEVERALGISHALIYQVIKAGEIRTFTIGRRRFVSADALREFIQNREKLSA